MYTFHRNFLHTLTKYFSNCSSAFTVYFSVVPGHLGF